MLRLEGLHATDARAEDDSHALEILRVEVEATIRSLDPAAATSDTAEAAARARAMGLVFEPLVTIDEHGLQPMLATSWESDPRGARWQIRLRSGVQLHDGSMLGTFPVGHGPGGLVSGGNNIWVLNRNDSTVTKLARDGTTLATFRVGTRPTGAAWDGVNLWVANNMSDTVTKLDGATGAPVGTFPAGKGPFGAAFDGANVWVTNFFDGTVSKLRGSDGATLAVFPVGDGAAGITFDGVSIWVTSNGVNRVTRLRPTDGAVLATYATGAGPFGVTSDGAAVWVANFASASVSTSR